MIDLMMTLAMAASAQTTAAACDQGSTVAIEECQQRRLKGANARLNAAYQTRMAHLSPSQQTQLRTQERAWIALRDAKCKVGPNQGTAGPIGAGDCLIEQTDARTRQLASGR